MGEVIAPPSGCAAADLFVVRLDLSTLRSGHREARLFGTTLQL